jgi:hypothetical protein
LDALDDGRSGRASDGLSLVGTGERLLPLAGVVYVIWIQGKLNKYGRWQRAQAHRSAVATSEVQSVTNWT